MTAHPPAPLPENSGLAYLGEPAWPPSLLADRDAKQLLSMPNACGRPNADVLRRRLAVVDDEPVATWQIDFPEHFTLQEAELYERPFALLRERVGNRWINPHAATELRRALSRLTRWLAMPADTGAPDWRWIEEELWPDATLVVVTREDDFSHGVLQSAVFAGWHAAHRTSLSSERIVTSFPFPWPPTTALNALSATQEEQRHTIARAIRTGDVTRLHETILAAYGWPAELTGAALLAKLTALHERRSA